MDGITHISEGNRQAELLQEINKDELDKDSKMSTIDLMSRLDSVEISNILAIDSLVSMNFLPLDVLKFTRQKKRLSVSKNGEGRKEIIKIFQNHSEEQEEIKKKNIISKIFGK
jgi:hypothetical protein